MGLSDREKRPNTALTGPELKEYVLQLMRQRLDADCVFNPGVAYPRVAFTISVQFHFANVSFPKHTVKPPVRAHGVIEGEPPLKDVGPGETQVVSAWERSVTVDNPNLVRVHAGLPIEVTAKVPAAPGEIFNRVERHAVTYEKGDYPEPEPPVDVDKTLEVAKEWGITPDSVASGSEVTSAELIRRQAAQAGMTPGEYAKAFDELTPEQIKSFRERQKPPVDVTLATPAEIEAAKAVTKLRRRRTNWTDEELEIARAADALAVPVPGTKATYAADDPEDLAAISEEEKE